MNDFIFVGLMLYLIYIPSFLFLLSVAKNKYKNYSISSFWVSNLGEHKSPSYLVFATSFFIFEILNLFFVKIFLGLLPCITLTKVATISFCLAIFSSMFIVFLPVDKKPKIHERVANLLFAGLFGSFLFTIYPIYISDTIPNSLIILNVIALFFLILLASSFIILRSKYGMEALVNMVEIRKKEKSFILRNAAFWEWIVLLLVTLWLFAAALAVYLGV